MQRASVSARGNDRQIREAGALPDEFMRELRFDFGIKLARLQETEHAAKTAFGNGASLFEEIDFDVRLYDPQLVHQSRQTLIIVQGITAHRGRDKPSITRLDLDDGTLVLIGIEIHVLAIAHEP